MKTVLITGATSGIGRATAIELAKNNFKLILCGRREDRLAELQIELEHLTKVHSLNFDVRKKKAVQEAIDSLPSEFSKIDVLNYTFNLLRAAPENKAAAAKPAISANGTN